MYFEDAVFTEDLRISSGEQALDKMFDKYMKEIFSPIFLKKINRTLSLNLKFKNFRERSNIMLYTQGTKIYINKPLFSQTEKSSAIKYIMHEVFHVLINTNKFPELKKVNEELSNIVSKAVPKGKESEFLTGKEQNIHSDWRVEVLSYLCNNSINWEIATLGTKLAYEQTLKRSGLFNMSSHFWKERF